jgi:hypothetical protein
MDMPVFSSNLEATTPSPSLELQEGVNLVPITIYNRALLVTSVRLSVEKSELPHWLRAEGVGSASIPRGGSSSEDLALRIEVIREPETPFFFLPVTLKSEEGRKWKAEVLLHINKNTSPAKFYLTQNTPNPFNPSTTIRYSVPSGTDFVHVRMDIFNIAGQLVKTVVNEYQKTGSYQAVWDGTDDQGMKVSSGVYCYRLLVGSLSETRRMTLLE